MIRPSSLPMLAQCPQFSPEGGSYAGEGTMRHASLRARFGDGLQPGLPSYELELGSEDIEGIDWVENYIRLHAPMADHALHIEYHLDPVDDYFNPLFENGGTVDYACGPVLFDFKWRERDYKAQMAAYALGLIQMSRYEKVIVHTLFGATRRAVVESYTEESALRVVEPIITLAHLPGAKPTPCDYCGWCAKRLTCPALLDKAQAVANGYGEVDRAREWHPSQMQTGQELADALWVWRKVLKKWGESVEYHALQAAQKGGLTLPGWEIKERAGKVYCDDVPGAFAACGLDQDTFLKSCDVRLNTSKSSPDRKGLIDLYRESRNIKKAAAKREVMARMGDSIKHGKPSVVLKEAGNAEEDE